MLNQFAEIQRRLANYQSSRINTTIASGDTMLDASLEQYLFIGESAIQIIAQGMLLTGLTQCPTVLDMPSGFGRVLRHLVTFLPESKIYVCDIERDAVDFCRKTFNAVGVYSKENFNDVHLDSTFDLI